MRVLNTGDRWYLEGWCHRAEAVRLFRLDRVVAIEVLDADGTPPPDAVGRDADERLFTPSPEDVVVTVDLEPAARWVATYYPVEHVVELGRRAAAGDAAGRRPRTGCRGWRCAWAASCASSRRPSWPRRCAGGPAEALAALRRSLSERLIPAVLVSCAWHAVRGCQDAKASY